MFRLYSHRSPYPWSESSRSQNGLYGSSRVEAAATNDLSFADQLFILCPTATTRKTLTCTTVHSVAIKS